MRPTYLVLAALVVLAACGTTTDEDTTNRAASDSMATALPTDGTTTIVDSVDEPPASTSSSLPSSSSSSSPPSSTTTSSASSSSTSGAGEICWVIADLDDDDEIRRWSIVNDGVMGGRSTAQTEVSDSILTVNGEIVTDGGGFSSIRLALDEPIGEARSLMLRVRTDGRAYELIAADTAPGRDRRTSHQGSIDSAGGIWDEVVIELETLEASIFGRPTETEPFEPTLAVEVGIILADGTDGPFQFELDWIRACR